MGSDTRDGPARDTTHTGRCAGHGPGRAPGGPRMARPHSGLGLAVLRPWRAWPETARVLAGRTCAPSTPRARRSRLGLARSPPESRGPRDAGLDMVHSRRPQAAMWRAVPTRAPGHPRRDLGHHTWTRGTFSARASPRSARAIWRVIVRGYLRGGIPPRFEPSGRCRSPTDTATPDDEVAFPAQNTPPLLHT